MKILKRGFKWLPLAIFPIALLCTTVDLDLENLEVSVDDTIPPVITIQGDKVQTIDINTSYSPVVVTAYDSVDGDLTESIDESGDVDTANAGTYKIYYTVYDLSLNKAKDSLVVTVVNPESNDTIAPVLTINSSSNPDTITVGDSWTNPTATAIDNGTEDISANIIISGTVDNSKAGTYYLIYSITDLGNNTTTDTLVVVVKEDSGTGAKPKLILTGEDTVIVALGNIYVEPGFTVVDTFGDTVNANVAKALVETSYYDSAGTLLASNVTLGNTEGLFSIKYYLEYSGAIVTEWRTVIVTNDDFTPPEIKILGDDPDTVWNSDAANYADIDTGANAGAIAIDNDTDTLAVTVKDSVNMSIAGTYKIHYSATDSNNNTTDTFRVVIVRVDDIAPVLTLSKSADTIDVGDSWDISMITATASDNANGNLTDSIKYSEDVDTTQKGVYNVVFTVKDAAENSVSDTAKIYVFALPQIVKVNGNDPDTVLLGTETYIDSGALITDNINDSIKNHPSYDKGDLNFDVAGIDTIHYAYTDADGNTTDTLARVVVIFDAPDTIPPVITIKGNNPDTVWVGDTYVDAGAEATDNKDNDLTASIVVDTSQVNTSAAGTFYVTYKVSDAAGNSDSVAREVQVIADTEKPVITIDGDNPDTVWQGDSYSNPSATATDNKDGTVSVSSSGTVNTDSAATYTITYTATDAANNTATKDLIVVVKSLGNELIVENFESGEKSQIALYTYLQDFGWWYGYKNDSSKIEPETTDSINMEQKVLAGAAKNGSWGMNVKMTIIGSTNPYAGIAFDLKGSNVYHDLSNVNQVSFWIKGSGVIRVYFATKHVNDLGDDAWGHFGKDIALTSEWQEIKLRPEDIAASPDNDKITQTWSEARTQVTEMGFELSDQASGYVTDMYLDDIRFYGITAIGQ